MYPLSARGGCQPGDTGAKSANTYTAIHKRSFSKAENMTKTHMKKGNWIRPGLYTRAVKIAQK